MAMKRIVAMLLSIMMVVTMMPTAAFAADKGIELTVDTSNCATAKAGETVSVPVYITKNSGVNMIIADVVYDSEIFDLVSIEGSAEFKGDGDYEITGTKFSWETDGDDNVLSDVLLFTVNLTVKDGATDGNTTITIKEDLIDCSDGDWDTFGGTVVPGTIKIVYDTVGLSFVNGSQTMIFAEAQDEANGVEGAKQITKPGDDYHFVGWFTGLTIEPTDEYYVIEPTGEKTTYAGTELRPKYDLPPTEGTYNALWIKGTGSYAVNVGASSLDVYVGDTDSTVLADAINGSNGARTKLVKDMTLSTAITTTAPMHLDMNGRTVNVKASSILKLGTVGNIAESSRDGGSFVGGKSKIFDTPKDSDYKTYGGQFGLIRDIGLIGAKGSEVLNLKGLTKIERCTLEGYIKIIDSEGTTLIDDCEITTSGFVLNTANTATITNTYITTTTTSSVPFLGAGILYLGAGNTLVAKTAQYLFLNLGKVEFTSVERCDYQVSNTTVLAKTLNGYTVPVKFPDGFSYSIDENGKISFGEPCNVTYFADGTLLTELTRTAMKGGYADLSVPYQFGNGTQYELVGWTTDPEAKTPMTQVLITGDITLYAVKREKPTNVGGNPIQGNKVEFSSDTSKTLSNAHKLGDMDELILTQNSGWAQLTFGASVLDSIAANVGSGDLNVAIDYKTVSEEGIFARLNVSLQKNDTDVTFDGAVNVRLRLGLSANVPSRNYRVFYIPENGEPVALATSIRDEGGNVYAYFTTTHFSTFEVRETAVANGYTAALDITETEVRAGGNLVNVNVDVTHSEDTKYNAGEVKVQFDNTLLTFSENDSTLPANALWQVEGNVLTVEFYGDEIAMPHKLGLAFTTVASVDEAKIATVTLTSAAFADSADAVASDLSNATIEFASDTVTIQLEELTVEKDDDIVLGEETVVKGTDYTFTVAQPDDYNYDNLKVTVDGIDITDKLVKGENGSYTIPTEYVTGEIVIEDTRTPNVYNVTTNFTGDDADAATTGTATYGVPFQFTIPTLDGYQYTLTSVVINGNGYTDYTAEGNVVTIPGADIKGEIVITIDKDDTLFNVTVEGNGAGDVTVADQNGENSYDKGDNVTLTVNPAPGYTNYVVTVTMAGADVTADLDTSVENQYTLNNIDGDIVFNVTKDVAGTVEVLPYLTLNADGTESDSLGMFLVLYTDDAQKDDEGNASYTPMCNGAEMYWSEKYGAFCYLVIDTNLAAAKEHVAITAAATTAATNETIEYTMNVNCSSNTDGDAADAQLVYDMYGAMYKDFSVVEMMKFLLADVNGDYKINMEDARAIISEILK